MSNFKIIKEIDKQTLKIDLSKNILNNLTEKQKEIYLTRIVQELQNQIEWLSNQKLIPEGKRPSMDKSMVSGDTKIDESDLIIDGQQVMQSWQVTLMEAMVKALDPKGKDVLEIGYGLGIASSFIQKMNPKSHTIIECNPTVYKKANEWKKSLSTQDINLIQAKWQDALKGKYERIFFDPYPFDENEFQERWLEDANFAEHFFDIGSKHLHPKGILTYFSNEISSLSRRHQRALLRNFTSFEIRIVELQPPKGCQYWWANQMAVVNAKK